MKYILRHNSHVGRILPFLLLPLITAGCGSSGKAPTSAYESRIQQERLEKDSTFRFDPGSPIPDTLRNTFEGLVYFPVDESFNIQARFVLNPDPQAFEMATTTERRPLYVVFGTARFMRDGKEHVLQVYQNLELTQNEAYRDHLFIPFRDLSSGKETYGGGRYLDVMIPSDTILTLDFNQAYNPYCAYNQRYSCPIPPTENTLALAIKAGEKTPANH